MDAVKQKLVAILKTDLENVVFLFDYDGTLHSTSVEGIEKAYLEAARRKKLETLAEIAEVAIVTGRSVSDIREKSGLDGSGIQFFGDHGCERWSPDKQQACSVNEAVEAVKEEVDEIRAQLAHLQTLDNIILENKTFALSWYTQKLDANCADLRQVKKEVKRVFSELNDYTLYERPIRIELAPGVIHKGHAVDYFQNRYPGKKILFAGDADNDIAAIEALKHSSAESVSIAIGPNISHVGADYKLDSSEDLWDILNQLV